MTWCKGCKKDLSPLKFMTIQSGYCDNCIELALAMCESGDHCGECPDSKECEEGR